jgi:hypothetical protein
LTVKLTLLALVLAVGIIALPGNATAWKTKHTAQSQWQQARLEQSRPDQNRNAWARWQAEQLRQARLYQRKLSRANLYWARVQMLQRKARVQLAKIESWHKRAERLARKTMAEEKRRAARHATTKHKQFVQVLVQARN